MITVTINSIPPRVTTVDEETITAIEDYKIQFSTGQWLPTTETADEIWSKIYDR